MAVSCKNASLSLPPHVKNSVKQHCSVLVATTYLIPILVSIYRNFFDTNYFLEIDLLLVMRAQLA